MVDQTTKRIDFFVVGAARSGTTSLYQYLSQHPQVYLPPVKELNYFSQVTSDQYQDYEEPLPNKTYHTKIIQSAESYDRLFEGASEGLLKGDVSPSYLWHHQTAKRIAEHNPNAKILVTLRHPVKRAFSHYLMAKSVGYDHSTSFEKAIEKLPPGKVGELRNWLEDYELAQEAIASSSQVGRLLDEEDGGESQLLDE